MLKLAVSNQRQFRDIIKQTMEEKPDTRDNTWLLFGGVMLRLKGVEYMKSTSLYDFIVQAASDPSIPKPATPTRYRNDIEKTNPELRGKTYEERHKHSKVYKEEFSNNE